MILLIDVGNTRIKWALQARDRRCESGVLAVAEVDRLADVLTRQAVRAVVGSCVAGEALRQRIEALAGTTPIHWLKPVAAGHGVVNRYRAPDTLGADRYAALIACCRLGHAPCVVVSAGTALTVDALTGAGEFLGGMILPGLGIMRRVLAEATAGVPSRDGEWQAFPKATADAVETGILTAAVETVSAMRQRLSAQAAADVTIVLAGGDGEKLAPHLPGKVVLEPNLVLEGVLWWARDLGLWDA